jgi:hypothetical protein
MHGAVEHLKLKELDWLAASMDLLLLYLLIENEMSPSGDRIAPRCSPITLIFRANSPAYSDGAGIADS